MEPTGPLLQQPAKNTASQERLLAGGFRESVAATHLMRGCCRCLRRRRRHRCRDCGLARCGGSRLRAGTGDQRQGENRKRRTKYDCSFHSMNCFFNKRIRRRSHHQTYLGRKILPFCDAALLIDKKCKLLEPRIEALQELVWWR